jgi:putative SOS response-associated peptidase YedK
MCGRTALTASPEDLREAFGLDEEPRVAPHYNVPPSRPLQVLRVVREPRGRKLEPLVWGLVPRWASDPKNSKIGARLALARVESIRTTPAFRDTVRWRRCLVAVDGFYEWQGPAGAGHGGKRAARRPFFIRRADGAPFALAGIWDRWVSKDGEVIESCAIVTQPARPPCDAVHDRMPLVLERDAWDAWLDPAITGGDRLDDLLTLRSPALIATPVSPYVNDPRNDDARCLEPPPPPPPEEAPRQLTLSVPLTR